jgi:GT2 family glycosyltransferase
VVVKKDTFMRIGQMDESLAVGLNDIDFCIRANEAGLKNIVCSKSALVHHESVSRLSTRSLRGSLVALREVLAFLKKHSRKDTFVDGYFG